MSPGIFECCHKCKPPKRNPYCHGDCPEYAAACEENEKRKAFENKDKGIKLYIAEGVMRQRTKDWKRHRRYKTSNSNS